MTPPIGLCLVFGAVSHTPALAQTVAVRTAAPPDIDARLERNWTDRLKTRGVLGLHPRASGGSDAGTSLTPDQQLTVSWERNPGSLVYFVCTDWSPTAAAGRDRSMAFKITQRLGW